MSDADWTITFGRSSEWAAKNDAEAFLRERGFSVGPVQGHSPRAIMFGDYLIAKWRNLSRTDIAGNDGVMTGNMRHGPVTIRIYAAGGTSDIAKRLAAITVGVAA